MEFVKDKNGELKLSLKDTSTLKNEYDFNEIKNLYVEFRKQECLELKRFLKHKKELEISMRGGCGRKEYTSGGRISNYDLTYWKYVNYPADEEGDNKINILISFQPLEVDPNSQNMHMLIDRVGISRYIGKYDANTVFNNMIITDIDLPLTSEDKEDIYKAITFISENTNDLTWNNIKNHITDEK